MAKVVNQVRSKRYKEAATKAVEGPQAVDKAVEVVKSFKGTKFDQSVELIFSLGIDAKHADQMIRGSLSLPHGIGKAKRVIAFCPDHLTTAALNAGAVQAGGQDLVQKIENRNDAGGNVHCVVGKVSFDSGKLVDNINAMVTQIRKMKPATSKGAYFKKVVVKATMTPAVQLAIS